VFATGTDSNKKYLLHRLVKKILVHSRRTIEVWYALPDPERFESWSKWLPECNSIRRGRGRTQTDVWFRIRRVALDGGDGASQASYCDQTVEVTLGPKGAFKKGNLGTLARRMAVDKAISALPEPRFARLLEPEALAPNVDRRRVMERPVENGRGEDLVVENLAPVEDPAATYPP